MGKNRKQEAREVCSEKDVRDSKFKKNQGFIMQILTTGCSANEVNRITHGSKYYSW